MDFTIYIPGLGFGEWLDHYFLNYYEPEGRNYTRSLLGDGPDAEGQRKRLEGIADLLFSAMKDLGGDGAVPLLEAVQSLKAISTSEGQGNEILYVLRTIDLRLAEDMSDVARAADTRLFALMAMARRTPLSRPAAEFLRRVSRCFLYGFDVECAIMCRAALDAEFQSEIPADDCRAKLGNRPTRDGVPMYDLTDRIAVARLTNRLNDATADLAHEVRKQTNPLVHRRPQPPGNVQEIVSNTLMVIASLGTTSP